MSNEQIQTWELETIANQLEAAVDESITIAPTVLDALTAPTRPVVAQAASKAVATNWDPDDFENAHLIWENGTPGSKLAPLGLQCNRLFQGHEFFEHLFKSKALAAEGGRHNALTRICGAVVAKLTSVTWGTPDLAHGLLYPVAASLGEDQDGTPFVDKLPEQITSWWKQDVERIAQADVGSQAPLTAKQEATALANIQRWLPEARDCNDFATVVQRLRQMHLGVLRSLQTGHVTYLDRRGFYCTDLFSPDSLPKELATNGLPGLVDLTYSQPGKTAILPRPFPHIVEADARNFGEVVMDVQHPGSYAELKTDESGNVRVIFHVVPFALRTDLDPTFSPKVEAWWTKMVAPSRVKKFKTLTALSLAFNHGQTPGMALIGVPAAGKKMFVQGIAECVTTETVCPGKFLLARFNGRVARSPFIRIDEGIPRGKDGLVFADVVRELLGGGDITVEHKGREPFDVSGVHRVFVTANNPDVISDIGQGEASTEDDNAAISQRFELFDIQQAAADHLAEMGGRRYTRGWIKGDDGTPSNYAIAKHVLWIYYNEIEWETKPADGAEEGTPLPPGTDVRTEAEAGRARPKMLGKRFLIEADHDERIAAMLDDSADGLTEVAEAINAQFVVPAAQNANVRIVGSDLYVLREAVRRTVEERTRPGVRKFSKVFSRLTEGTGCLRFEGPEPEPSLPNASHRPLVIGSTPHRWRKVRSIRRLVSLISNPCPAIRALIETNNQD